MILLATISRSFSVYETFLTFGSGLTTEYGFRNF